MLVNWIIIFSVLLLIEIFTLNLVTIWFALGALVAAIVYYFTSSIQYSIITFLLVSIISLIVTKPLIKKLKVKEPAALNLDRVVGKIGIVTEDMDKHETGEVKVDGKRWSAIAKEKITKGSKVKILSIEGVKLIVRKEED